MKRLHLIAGITFCFLVAAATVQAGTIYEQLPGLNQAFISSTLDLDSNIPGYQGADDFVLGTTEIITDIHWWGFSVFGSNDFQFTFYNDAAGIPGTAIHTTGGSLSTTSAGLPPYATYEVLLYSSFLDTTFSPQANTRYWLSIFNSATDASWVWIDVDNQTVTGNQSHQRQLPSGAWDPNGTDLSFRLTDDANPIPEPTTMLLLGTGIVGVAGAARRKKKNQA